MDRLIYHREDVRAVIVAAFESGRQQAHEGANREYTRGYLCALRVVACGFGFQVAEPTDTMSTGDGNAEDATVTVDGVRFTPAQVREITAYASGHDEKLSRLRQAALDAQQWAAANGCLPPGGNCGFGRVR